MGLCCVCVAEGASFSSSRSQRCKQSARKLMGCLIVHGFPDGRFSQGHECVLARVRERGGNQ